MNTVQLKQALQQGQTVCGTLIASPSPKWAKYIGQIGLDFVFIDTEHVALDTLTLSWMCTAYAAMNLAPIVRIPSADPARASVALDAGAGGILVPYIEDVDTLRQMVGAVHHKPVKGEKLRAALSGERPYPQRLQSALAHADEGRLLFANIESLAAVENLDALLEVPGLDGIVVGPNDLSYSMDMPNDYQDARFQQMVCAILSRARERGVPAGVHALGPIDQQIQWAQRSGMNMLWHSGDVYAFISSMRDDIARYRAAIGDEARPRGGVAIEI